MTKPGSNPYTRKLKPVMTKYLTGRFGAAEGASRWQRTLVLFVAGYMALFVIGGIDGLRRGFTFWQFFLRFFTIGAVIKAFDILALDWFLLTKTHFFQHYFPETEGCAGWQDFGYNRRQQARQCAMIVLGSAVTAWIFTLF